MEDINYNELFGIEEDPVVTDEEPSGEKGPEPAEPEEAEEPSGEKEQEPADPDVIDDNEADEKPAQSDDDNARFAAARRKAEAERDAAIAAERKKMQAELDEAIKGMDLKNPYTQQPITSKAEYDEYKAKFVEEKKNRIQKKAGMSDEQFEEFVQSLPEVREAKAAKERAEAYEREALDRSARQAIDEQIRKIHTMNPEINSVEDLARMDTYGKLYEYAGRGLNLEEAYLLANHEALQRREAEAAKQQTYNSQQSRAHMSRTSSRGDSGPTVKVPDDVMEAYRLFNPDASDAEIRAHYARSHKN